jgi:hypothetical protein
MMKNNCGTGVAGAKSKKFLTIFNLEIMHISHMITGGGPIACLAFNQG